MALCERVHACVCPCALSSPGTPAPLAWGAPFYFPLRPAGAPPLPAGARGSLTGGVHPVCVGGVDGQQVYEPRTWRSDQLVGRPLGKQDVTRKPHGSQRAASECFLFARLNPDSVPGLFSSGSDSASFRMISFSVVFCLRLLVSATGTLCLWAVTP